MSLLHHIQILKLIPVLHSIEGSQYHTIQCNDRVKLDLRVEEGLDGRGDVIRVIVPIVSFAVAVAVIVRMVVMGHDENIDI